MRIAVTSIVDLERTAHNRLHQLLRPLAKRHEVTVFSIQDWWKSAQVDESLYRAGFEDVVESVRVVPFTPRRVSPVLQEALAVRRASRLVRENGPFDVHFDYNTLLSGAAFARVFARLGVPTVYDLADDLVAMVRASPQIPAPARPLAGAVAQRALDRNLKGARRVTVINPQLAHDARVDREKTVVLPNGVDVALFTPEGPSAREALGLEGAFVVGYVGVLREWVDFRPLLEAMARIGRTTPDGRPLRLLVVGKEGDDGRLRRDAEALGVMDQVVLAGTVPYPDVPRHVRAMDAGVIPFSVGKIGANSLPLKLFEYMACGKPVVSTPLAGVQECAADRVLYAADAQGYVDALARLLKDPGAGDDARRWVLDNYSWKGIGVRLERLLEDAAARSA